MKAAFADAGVHERNDIPLSRSVPCPSIAWVLLGVLTCWSAAPHAQVSDRTSGPLSAPPSAQMLSPLEGERLSDWLLRQPADPRAYASGLVWQVPSERFAQADVQRNLLVWLALTGAAPAAARDNLTRLIKALPVTGRVPVPRPEARWLQGHPNEDPVLHRDHVLALPPRPDTVSVITNDGTRCTLPHRTGSEARDYLRACEPQNIDRVDRAWVVQPDGTVRDVGIARWNAQAQDEAAPGALIWGPARDKGWSPQFSTLLAQFLATQGYDAIVSGTVLAGVAPVSPLTQGGPARDPAVTANDWGVIGLLQTPTARMSNAGEARFNYSLVYPYERYNVLLQPLDWLEAGFRYTNIRNRLYGPAELSGTQTYKDKSVDLKIRLFRETASLPQVAIGATDIGGTGLFSSEYLVANKRSGNFDWSLGMGWGYMGSSGNIANPFSLIGKNFNTRANVDPTAGSVNATTFFHGNTALFGGVQYHTPSDKWLIKAEYDGNNYQSEPQGNNQTQRVPINVGLIYRYGPGVDFNVGLERGSTLMVGMTLHTPLDRLDAPKLSDAPAPRVVAGRPKEEPFWQGTASELSVVTNWAVSRISREAHVLKVVIEGASGAYWNDRIERMTAVLHRDAPADIDEFVLIFAEQGIPMSERVILREPWVTKNLQFQAMSDRFQSIAMAEPPPTLPAKPVWEANRSPFGYSIVPSWQQNLGGPDGFLLFSAGMSIPAQLKISENTFVAGTINAHLVDNYSKFKYTAPSNLPRVRTYLREYTTASAVTIPNLQITHTGALGGNQYYSLYGGYLESMFAGVGGEWLYRPFNSPFAFGIDVNRVKQRSYEQDFGFGNAGDQTGYRVTTGHATAYWDTGWKSTQVKLNVGRYLAGDIGATLDIGRTFNNGVAIGAWATKTNISAATFGEGSFDKGIYLRIPFDVMTTTRNSGVANLVYNPLTRDGGARLSRSVSLYNLTNSRSRRETGYGPAGSIPEDDTPAWASDRSLLADLIGTGRNLGGEESRTQIGNALWVGGGLVLASSLLDRRLDDWAVKHQGPRWNTLGKAANNLPLLLAAGTGMLWWGLGGDGASETAWTALKSTALTLGVDTLLRIGTNRARPDANLGTTHFDPMGKGSAQSGFPSNHMGAAFALVTPFAQDYDAPWLYAVAGATAFGRIQQRQHFASDVVAGSLIGYVTGTLLLDQQHKNRRGPKVSIGANRGITAAWELD